VKRIIAGRRAVQEALRASSKQLSVLYVDQREARALSELVSQATSARIPIESVDRDALTRLAQGVKHQGIVAVAGAYPHVSVEEILNAAEPAPLLLALDQVQDPHNLGAMVRSAVALGADGVITLKDRACPVNATVVRTSAGATEFARIARVTNLRRTLDALGDAGLERVGLAAEGDTTLDELPYPQAGRVLVVGSEGQGLRRLVREGCDRLARIEQVGPIASLNASVAAGIALSECARGRRAALDAQG